MPAGLNWDLWIGPREPRPWHPAYAPVTWRDFWAFGTGSFGDFGCHDMDAPCWALDLDAPESVEASRRSARPIRRSSRTAACATTTSRPTSARPAVKLTWYDGGLMPELPAAYDRARSKYRRGVLFVGEKGYIACEGAGGPPQLALLRPGGHLREAPAHAEAFGGPSSRLDRRLQGRPAGQQQLRVRRPAHGNHPAGRAGPATGQEDRLGRRPDAGPRHRPPPTRSSSGTYRKGWEVT